MKTMIAGMALLVITMIFSIYFTLPMIMFMLAISAFVMAVGVIFEITGGKRR